jgi:hypothetical protein
LSIFLRNSLNLDHPSVQNVIKIAQEIISENKVLDTETLYNMAKNQLNIPRKGLLRIIQFLINKKILVEGSKLTKELVLNNAYRRRIYRFIKSHIGVHFSIIKKIIFEAESDKSGSAGQLLWHLKMLIKFNYIKKIRFKKYTIFVPVEIDDKMGKIFFLLRDKINKKIVNLLVKKKSIEKSEIHKNINETRELVYYRINDLIDQEILSQIDEKNNLIRLNPDNKDLIIQICNNLANKNRNNSNI